MTDVDQIIAWFEEQAAKEQRLLDTGSCNPSLTQERWLVYKGCVQALRDGLWKKPRQKETPFVTAATITDDQINALRTAFPTVITQVLVDGALADVQPHRNHSRDRIAGLAQGLLCDSCTPRSPVANHVPGHRFVGWGHGWQPCLHCDGSGLSDLGQALRTLCDKDVP